jgi:hypothetical protein
MWRSGAVSQCRVLESRRCRYRSLPPVRAGEANNGQKVIYRIGRVAATGPERA